MTMQNLAIVFGPTLFGAGSNGQLNGGTISDAQYQNLVSLVILAELEGG